MDLRMGKPGVGNATSPLPEHIGQEEGTGGIETSQYPQEQKATATPQVAASERGPAQTRAVYKPGGVAVRG